jgi:broad specificity phosphatase PhoE
VPRRERRLILARHCLTDFNVVGVEGRFLGTSDPPLNQKGVEEALELRELLRDVVFDIGYAGRSKRSQETLQLILRGREVPVSVDPLLDEIDYGAWDGLTHREVMVRFPEEWPKFREDPATYIPPEGEPASKCLERAMDWLAASDFQRALAVVDKTWLRLLLCALLGIPTPRYRDNLDAKIASLAVLVSTPKGWRMDALNYGATRNRVL